MKLLVFIPTYNEKENVENILHEIVGLRLDLDVLFLDDNSPDGTGEILDELAKKNNRVHVIHRQGKLGIGSAHQEGIRWAYKYNYSLLITMDCDFTHSPDCIPVIINNSDDYDVVIGSRYMLKDSLEGWNLFRKFLTVVGHFMTKYLLKMPYDATGAFRLYHLDKIPEYAFENVSSKGYSFFFESLYILYLNRYAIKEIPIKLPPRTYGHSKMRMKDAWHSLTFLFTTSLTTLFYREKYETYEPFIPEEGAASSVANSKDWDDYWESRKGAGGLIYDAIASFYRKSIIKRALNYFIRKHIKRGSQILHAGCGTGQVDKDNCDDYSIIALDISLKALSIYKKINKNHGKLMHGNIFNIPLPDASVDGIYNLGVMEHFNMHEIQQILSEFYRVLKPNGKLIIFWPPEFGLSVLFFKFFRLILQPFFKKELMLYPSEICRIQSKEHAVRTFRLANMKIIDYYFGMRDVFTHSIVVAIKN
jgi:dolichol-phosphate mannosyltransferase